MMPRTNTMQVYEPLAGVFWIVAQENDGDLTMAREAYGPFPARKQAMMVRDLMRWGYVTATDVPQTITRWTTLDEMLRVISQ